ncbi:MAG TPA: right-handed parallel beta-helix repeat-containing protein [Flavobacteriales bacterium]|nr:right-handed parallel beta-helix repeat-containing protein [Flavobacteriales bacterium]HMR26125.1 right-handed parallel beta-helix repeat-containing protein [Flavobacteriales bacterium]
MSRPCRPLSVAVLLSACTPALAQLSGTYTIDGSGAGDYLSFGAAIDDLNALGVNGPVLFEVTDGSYSGRATIGAVAGVSAVNTVTFRGQSLDSSLVTWSEASYTSIPSLGHNSLLRLDGARYITLEHMTLQRTGTDQYAHVVVIDGSTAHVTVRHCRLRGPTNFTAAVQDRNVIHCASGTVQADIRFEADRIEHGNHGLYWWATAGEADEVSLEGCDLHEARVWFQGITGQVHLLGNTSFHTQAANCVTALSLSGDVDISRNTLRSVGLYTTLALQQLAGTAAQPIRVANNMVIGSNSTVSLVFCDRVDLLHNSVSGAGNISNGNTAIRMLNNSWYRDLGYALTVGATATVIASDHNCYHTVSGAAVSWSGGHTAQASLTAATGLDANSLFMDPVYVDPLTDLHIQTTSPCSGTGTLAAGVTDDRDAELRPRPALSDPDIGADETDEYCFTLNGTYTIGPSVGADFPTFSAAVLKLSICGITGPVLFLVEDGVYTEAISLPAITGTSSTNTVTFRGNGADSTAVTLRYPATATSAPIDHVVRMEGADHVAFERITLERYGVASYGTIFRFRSGGGTPNDPSTHIRFTGCRFLRTGAIGFNSVMVSAANSPALNEVGTVFEGNYFNGGVYAFGNPGNAGDEWTITNNVVENVQGGITVFQASSVTISGNRVTMLGNSLFPAIKVTCGCDAAIDDNRVLTRGTALELTVAATAGAPAWVTNNTLISDLFAGHALRILGLNNHVRIVHNSVSAYSGRALFASAAAGSSDLWLLNNILASRFSHPLDAPSGAAFSDVRHNLLQKAASTLATWNGASVTTLTALQSVSGMFANSFAGASCYFDPASDLHSYSMEADGAALPFALFPTDMDGEPRSTTTPDIGADEFQPQLWSATDDLCVPADPITSTGTGTDQWIYKDRKVVARFNDNGQPLGIVQFGVFLNSGPVRQSLIGQHYLDRNWHFTTSLPMSGTAIVRLFHSADEFADYAAADPVVNVYADAGVAHYAGPMEDCALLNNPAGNVWMPTFPASPALEPRIQSTGGTHGYTALLGADGELYITIMGAPLPVELLTFTGHRINEREVRLDWSTATEHNNAGFEVWRMIEGEDDFTEVGWVDGEGDSQQRTDYIHVDANATGRQSYYKLRQVDHDGQQVWTAVVPVAGAQAGAQLVAYPNPATDHVRVEGATGEARMALFDAAGRMVRGWSPAPRIDGLAGLHRGCYTLVVERAPGARSVLRVMLQ